MLECVVQVLKSSLTLMTNLWMQQCVLFFFWIFFYAFSMQQHAEHILAMVVSVVYFSVCPSLRVLKRPHISCVLEQGI